ncbi:CarD-like/TRCF domain protein [uncultured archaeon]|nr:CarD-like/TRCF domain protein [uncultured archaeon]
MSYADESVLRMHETPQTCHKCGAELGFSKKCIQGCDDGNSKPRPKRAGRFKIGDKVFYTNHGIFDVENVGEVPGASADAETVYYSLRLAMTGAKVLVPVRNRDRMGLRRLLNRAEAKKLIALIEGGGFQTSSNWKDRYRENLEKLKCGRPEDLAHVLLSLCRVKTQLSDKEKRMWDKTAQMFTAELALARDLPETEMQKELFRALEAGAGQTSRLTRPREITECPRCHAIAYIRGDRCTRCWFVPGRANPLQMNQPECFGCGSYMQKIGKGRFECSTCGGKNGTYQFE